MILVTGGAGFIGTRLCARLRMLGHHVVSLDDYSTGSRLNHVAGVTYLEGRTSAIAELVPLRPELIVHLGEYSRVERSVVNRHRVHDSNVVGTTAVLRYWQRCRCKLVYAGSSTRFATDDSHSPYATSKRENADRVLRIGQRERLPHAVTYFYNVYGPGERAGATGTLVEIFRQQMEHDRRLPVVAPGTQRRNFTHVDDIVDGLLLVAAGGIGEFPIGAAESYSVLEVAEMFGGEVVFIPPRTGNRADSTIDTTAIRALGWRQQRKLQDYVREVLPKEWA